MATSGKQGAPLQAAPVVIGDPVCFVIMPISDPPSYVTGHFQRVYDYLIKPAIVKAGFRPLRADEVNQTNYIVLDVLRHVLDAPMALCDLSGHNPSVFYELGVRQAFNKPVTLMKDLLTGRAFDIQGLRDIEYDQALRVDAVEKTLDALADSLRNTYESHQKPEAKHINSVVQLLGVQGATPPQSTEISAETSLVLATLTELGDRMSAIESTVRHSSRVEASAEVLRHPARTANTLQELAHAASALRAAAYGVEIGEVVKHRKFGIGRVVGLKGSGRDRIAAVEFEGEGIGRKNLVLAQANLEILPTDE